MTKKRVGLCLLATLVISLGYLDYSSTVSGQDCGGYPVQSYAFGSCGGEGVIQESAPVYSSGCSGSYGSYYGYQYQPRYYSIPSYGGYVNYGYPSYPVSRYQAAYRWNGNQGYGTFRSRGRWVCNGNGCYLID